MATKKIRIACVVDADGSWNAVSWHNGDADDKVGQGESDWRDAAWEGDLGASGIKRFLWIEAEIPVPDAEESSVPGTVEPSLAIGDVKKVLEGFERGHFVRDISRDAESGWAIAVAPYLTALARLSQIAGDAAAGPEAEP